MMRVQTYILTYKYMCLSLLRTIPSLKPLIQTSLTSAIKTEVNG